MSENLTIHLSTRGSEWFPSELWSLVTILYQYFCKIRKLPRKPGIQSNNKVMPTVTLKAKQVLGYLLHEISSPDYTTHIVANFLNHCRNLFLVIMCVGWFQFCMMVQQVVGCSSPLPTLVILSYLYWSSPLKYFKIRKITHFKAVKTSWYIRKEGVGCIQEFWFYTKSIFIDQIQLYGVYVYV